MTEKEEIARLRLSKQKTHLWLNKMGIPECVGEESCRAAARAKILEERIFALQEALFITKTAMLNHAGWDLNFDESGRELPMTRPKDVQKAEAKIKVLTLFPNE
jgi:hypothetical protein